MAMRLIVAVLLTVSIALEFQAGWWVSESNLLDFGAFRQSAALAQAGENPYPLAACEVISGESSCAPPNLNPPFSLLLFAPLPHLPPVPAYYGWQLVSLALYLIAVIACMRAHLGIASPFRLGWALAYYPLWATLSNGQLYILLFVPIVAIWLALRTGRTVLPALLLGFVVALKPNFGLWALLLVVAGHARLGLLALGTAAGLSLLPALVYGPEVYRHWLILLADGGPLLAAHPYNLSVLGLAASLGLSGVSQPLAAVVGVALLGWAWRSRPDALGVSRAGIVGTLLIGPITWSGYLLVAIPLLLERRWHAAVAALAVALAIPPFPLPPVPVVSWVFAKRFALAPLALMALALWRAKRHSLTTESTTHHLTPQSLPTCVRPAAW